MIKLAKRVIKLFCFYVALMKFVKIPSSINSKKY